MDSVHASHYSLNSTLCSSTEDLASQHLAQQQHSAQTLSHSAAVRYHAAAATADLADHNHAKVDHSQLACPNSPLEFPAPSPFRGATNGFGAIAFLRQLDRYFRANMVEPRFQTSHASVFLEGHAQVWFKKSGFSDDTPFSTFEAAFRKTFIPNQFDQRLRFKIANLRMTTTVPEYITQFRFLLYHLLTLSSPDSHAEIRHLAISSLLKGVSTELHRRLMNKLESDPSIDVQELCDFALNLDTIYNFKPDRHASNTSVQATQPAGIHNQRKLTDKEISIVLAKINDMKQHIDRLADVLDGKTSLHHPAAVARNFDPNLPATVEIDVSRFTVGAVMYQIDSQGCSHPVASISKKLSPAEQNYPTNQLAVLAACHALHIWHNYLVDRHFVVYIDREVLQDVPMLGKLSARHLRWIEFLGWFDFDFRFKHDNDNISHDVLLSHPPRY